MVKIITIKDHERHYYPNHPEKPERVEWIVKEVGYSREWERVDESLLERVHHPEYISLVKTYVGWLDPDTYVTPYTYQIAARAATASYYAKEGSLILTRPPGHHATRNKGMGFCIFNNAVFSAISKEEKVGILDVDAHHGNGTEELLPENAVYASVHMGSGYPGTGRSSDKRRFNMPVYHSLTDKEFAEFLEMAFRFFQERGVEFIVVSLGFDGLYSDPLTYFSLTPKAFYELGERIREWSWVAVLEGGYSPLIGEAAKKFIEGISKG